MFYHQTDNPNYYSYNPYHNSQYSPQSPPNIRDNIQNPSYSPPTYYQEHTHPIYNQNPYTHNTNWEEIRNIDVPYSDLFRRIADYAAINNFAGGFPTFRRDPARSIYEIILINPQYGVKEDIRNLPSPANFAQHIRNTDRNLKENPRYLSGFPNFHVSASGNLFGATRLFKNAGERRWVSDSELGIIGSETDENLMTRAQMYAERNGFAGGFPSFEHSTGNHEIILLNKDAATKRIEYFPV